MSTSIPVHLALGAALLGSACSQTVDPDPSVSYSGLDAPLGSELRPPIVIGILADASGPGGAGGRAFSDAMRARLGEASPLRERLVRVVVFDDRGTLEGVQGAASRLEHDPGVLLAIVQPGLGRTAIAAQVAYHTPIVCVGCEASEATREGSFALGVRGDREPAEVGAEWVLAALRATPDWVSCPLASTLRSTPAPAGTEVREGALPGRDPYIFRLPPGGASRP